MYVWNIGLKISDLDMYTLSIVDPQNNVALNDWNKIRTQQHSFLHETVHSCSCSNKQVTTTLANDLTPSFSADI